jgi:Xaa-Pro aminopeptidase
VHDAGDFERPIPVGAVFTVEPGIYLPKQGFGIRIEDEVLMTEHGYRLLTSAIPRKLEEVEAWIARERRASRAEPASTAPPSAPQR